MNIHRDIAALLYERLRNYEKVHIFKITTQLRQGVVQTALKFALARITLVRTYIRERKRTGETERLRLYSLDLVSKQERRVLIMLHRPLPYSHLSSEVSFFFNYKFYTHSVIYLYAYCSAKNIPVKMT